jgi:hypothetical protein
MWDRFKENRDFAAINTLTSLVRAIATVLIFLLPAGIVSQFALPIWAKIACVGVIFGLALVFWAYFRGRRKHPFIRARQKQNPNPNLEVVERHEICNVINYATYEIFYALKLKITGDIEETFTFYTEWTGRDDLEVRVETPGFNVIEVARNPLVTKVWKIIFDRRRYKGEIFDIRYSIYTEGNIRDEENFLSHTFKGMDCPKSASLAVKFSPDVNVDRVWTEEYFPNDAMWPISPGVERECGSSRMVVWPFRSEDEHRYCIRWTFGEE